ncbi:hypothetical protein GOBAR_AA04889 [Gossypium barbadense]|uniref:C2 NT-type domain-containing protein n=1 Tax=Gossypium barbadense TaxID=3634 RepID=A0A2P5YJD6_GOSBA|nr:hypothetical protein GOBAR_AA04889 [Gossypium barbadense]
MATATGRRNSNTQLLDELEALSQSLYQSHISTTRRTASLALPRSSLPPTDEVPEVKFEDNKHSARPRARRLSLSPWRSRPKADDQNDNQVQATRPNELEAKAVSTEKKGIWNWKPIRALTHIGMQKLSCLLSVEVVTAQGLPASMNGLRLSVCVRKKETKDGAVNTMPSRVSQGAADFEETLFVRCHVYCSSGNGKPTKFEPRPFWIYLVAVDAEELDFGRNTVDLSLLIQESVEKSYEGTRVRQWDMSFNLLGKAKGGELIVKLGFQIMEKDGGIGIYNQASTWRAMEALYYSGKARAIGVSNFSSNKLRDLLEVACIPPAVVQFECHLWQQLSIMAHQVDYGLTSSEDQLGDPETLTLALVVQLRDPLRRYEAVGGPVLALVHASSGDIEPKKNDEEKRFKVMSLHVGGLKVGTPGKRNIWDSERHRLTAMQWLVAYGLGKSGRKGKQVVSKGQDLLWSLSSRVMADMWLKTMRNPDVKFAK